MMHMYVMVYRDCSGDSIGRVSAARPIIGEQLQPRPHLLDRDPAREDTMQIRNRGWNTITKQGWQ